MVNKFVLNTVLQHVDLSWIIESNQQLEYDIDKDNTDWLKCSLVLHIYLYKTTRNSL